MLRPALLVLCVSPLFAQVAPPPVSTDPPLRDLRTLMCDRGQELYHDDFDAHSPPAWGGWSAGEWTTSNGIMRVAYTGGHPVYHEHKLPLKDVVMQMSFRFDEGVDFIGMGMDGGPHHHDLMWNFHRTSVDLQRAPDVGGKDGHDQIDSAKVNFESGRWYTMMMELCGTEMVVTVDESVLLYGSAEGIDCNKDSIVLTASPSANKYASFAHARLWRANLKPGWAQKREQVKRLLAQRSEATPEAVSLLLQDDPGRSPPFFATPAAVPKVARIEAQIAAGGVVPGSKALEHLTSDKDAATAAAATASLAVVAAWKQAMDAAIARGIAAGDLYGAAETAMAMGKLHPGDPGKAYRDQAAELKKDPAYTAGKEYQKLAGAAFAVRAAPGFAAVVETFVKKYPDGYYAQLAPHLVVK